MSEQGSTEYKELSEDDRTRLNDIKGQLDEAGKFLDGVLMAWNHPPKTEYLRLEEVARAVSTARNAADHLS